MISKINPRPLVLAIMIIAVGVFRIITANAHSSLSGFTPLGAMALFGGFYFHDRWKAYLLPLLTLWLSDIVLNRFVYFGEWVFFYTSFQWVYISFACIVFIGQLMRKVSLANLILTSGLGAVAHWLISDFGVWLGGCTGTSKDIRYTPTLNGLVDCYYMALPSLGNFLIGNLIFGAILFGSFEIMQQKFTMLRLHNS